jgi:hypothetical protein
MPESLWTGLNGPLQPPWGVNSPWRMFLYDHNSVSGSTGPSKSNQKVKTTETEPFLKTTHFEVFWGLRLAPLSTPNPPSWVQTSVGVYQIDHCCVFFVLGYPFNTLVLSYLHKVWTLKKGVIWHVRGPLKGSQQPPTAAMGGQEPLGDAPLWWLVGFW